MILKIICAALSSVGVVGNIAYVIFELVRLPHVLQGFNAAAQTEEDLSTEKAKLKAFAYTIYRLAGIGLAFLVLGVGLFKLSGIPEYESYIAVSLLCGICITVAGWIMLSVYLLTVKHKYNVKYFKISPRQAYNSSFTYIALILAINIASNFAINFGLALYMINVLAI